MKRFLALLLAMTMLLTLTACGKKPADKDSADTTTTTGGDTTATTTTTAADTTTTTAGDTTTSTEAADTSATGTASTTKKPTTTQSGGEDNSIRILAVGDNATVDAMEKYLYDLLKSAGYKNVHLGVLYADKSTLDTHYNNVKSDKAVYEFRQNTDGKWKKETKVAPSKALKAADWDYVVLQQSAADAGVLTSYGKLGDLLPLIKKQCDADIYWHLTWAFRRSSDPDGFDNYKYSEQKMFESVIDAALRQVMRHNDMMGIIPSGTAIQNLRTSVLRDDLTKDGVRLTDYGAYAAALTWYSILTGESAADVTHRPSGVKDRFAELAEAADNAVSLPNKVTSTTAGEGAVKDLKILSIGHSFSLDAMRTYMWDLFAAAGYDVTIGYLYYPSCSLEQHYHYVSDNSASYEQYGKNSDGKWVTQSGAKATDALWDEDWDIVTFQPDPDYGHGNVPNACKWGCGKNIESDYVHFDELVDKVLEILASPDNPNGPNTDVQLYYHLTWTWREDCYLYSMSGLNQSTLYQAFIDATKNNILTNPNIKGVIPCNTTIQNARTTWMGDTFNAEGSNDGYHLSDKGDLAAAMTWVSYFTGTKASNIYVDTVTYTAEQIAAIAEAVENAIAHPWEVTQSSYKTKP